MIQNDFEYHRTRELIAELERTLAWLEDHPESSGGLDPRLQEAERSGYRGTIADLKNQMAAYEAQHFQKAA